MATNSNEYNGCLKDLRAKQQWLSAHADERGGERWQATAKDAIELRATLQRIEAAVFQFYSPVGNYGPNN